MAKLSLYLAALLLGNGFGSSTVPAQPVAIVAPSQVSAESKMVQLVNTTRWDQGLSVLAVNPTLVQVAREHSREMYEKSYFSHISPTAGMETSMDRYKAAINRQPTWAFLGENLFYCSVVNPAYGHRCLMASPSHRANILNPRYEQIGVGVYIAPDGRFWVTELFLAQID